MGGSERSGWTTGEHDYENEVQEEEIVRVGE